MGHTFKILLVMKGQKKTKNRTTLLKCRIGENKRRENPRKKNRAEKTGIRGASRKSYASPPENSKGGTHPSEKRLLASLRWCKREKNCASGNGAGRKTRRTKRLEKRGRREGWGRGVGFNHVEPWWKGGEERFHQIVPRVEKKMRATTPTAHFRRGIGAPRKARLKKKKNRQWTKVIGHLRSKRGVRKGKTKRETVD